MNNSDYAVKNLEGHSVCLYKDGNIVTDDGKGIAPLLKLIASGSSFEGWAAADEVVGKAAAMMFAKMGVESVFGRVMSVPAKDFLEKNNISYSYGELVKIIVNRMNTGMCPMEQTVLNIDDVDMAHLALINKLEELKYEGKNK